MPLKDYLENVTLPILREIIETAKTQQFSKEWHEGRISAFEIAIEFIEKAIAQSTEAKL